jgi:hypothetical protein
MPLSLTIPDAELIERFVRASGPGGQNVNKVATAVELRFDVANSPTGNGGCVLLRRPENARCAVSRRSDTPPRARSH